MKIQTYNPTIGCNEFYVSSYDEYIKILKSYILSHGYISADFRLQRQLAEVVPLTVIFSADIMGSFVDAPLPHRKFNDFLGKITYSLRGKFKRSFDKKHYRRLIIFDTDQHPETFSCISAIHFLPNEYGWNMIVYQRASSIIKLNDDMNFLVHVMMLFQLQFSVSMHSLIINYGTIHYEIK